MGLSYTPPPQITIEGVIGKCHDCGAVTKAGNISINLQSYHWRGDVALMTGGLLELCQAHHERNKSNKLEHSEFTMTEGNRHIGDITVSTQAYEVGIRNLDSEIDIVLRKYEEESSGGSVEKL
ncbi:MAG: hypothetical protein AAB569_03060 [Patescibacteria group bacterium]